MTTQSRGFQPNAFEHDAFQVDTASQGAADGFATASLARITGTADGSAIVYAESRFIAHLVANADGFADVNGLDGQPSIGTADGYATAISSRIKRAGSGALLAGI